MPRHTENALTDRKIQNAKPTNKQFKLFDGKGLFLLIHPNGSKYFRWDYAYEGKRKTLALGFTLRPPSNRHEKKDWKHISYFVKGTTLWKSGRN